MSAVCARVIAVHATKAKRVAAPVRTNELNIASSSDLTASSLRSEHTATWLSARLEGCGPARAGHASRLARREGPAGLQLRSYGVAGGQEVRIGVARTIQPRRTKMMNLDRTDTPAGTQYATVYVAFELSKAKWKL